MNFSAPPMDFLLPNTRHRDWPWSHHQLPVYASSCACCRSPSQRLVADHTYLSSLSHYQTSCGLLAAQVNSLLVSSASSSSSSSRHTNVAPDGHPSVPTLIPELGFSPTPSDGYSSDVPPSPTSSLESQLNDYSARPNVHVVCNAPLVAPIPLPGHLPTLFSCELPDIDEDLSHPPYMRPFKRKRASPVYGQEPNHHSNHSTAIATPRSPPQCGSHPDQDQHLIQPPVMKKRRTIAAPLSSAAPLTNSDVHRYSKSLDKRQPRRIGG